MPSKPGEYKTVQARILAYAQEIGWTYVPRGEAEERRGFDTPRRRPPSRRRRRRPISTICSTRRCGSSIRSMPKAPARWSATCAGCTRTSPAIATSSLICATRGLSTTRPRARAEPRPDRLRAPGEQPLRGDRGVLLPQRKHGTREDVVFLINGIPVLVIECKNATKDEAIALGVDQVRRYHAETPELFVPQMVFTATEAIGFSYGVTWNLLRRNIFNWKNEQKGNLEAKVKSFCSRGHVLALLKDYILFAEKDEELQKFILRQHQTTAVERVVERCLTAPPKPEARRGLVWHTQGSGKTFTMIKAAELLFKAAGADKPTVLVLIDRNELEDQMLRNLAMLGLRTSSTPTASRR